MTALLIITALILLNGIFVAARGDRAPCRDRQQARESRSASARGSA